MKNMQRLLCVLTLGLLVQARGEVIFLDTFDRSEAVYSDINSNLVARQTGGTTGSSYTLTVVGDGNCSLSSNPQLGGDNINLLVKGPATNGAEYTALDLDTDFGSSLVGKTWEFSYRERIQRAIGYGGYTGFTVGNPADTTSGAGNGFSFQFEPTGAWKVYNDGSQVGSGNAGEVTYFNNFSVSALFNETMGKVELSVFFDGTTNRVVLGTFAATFADSSRYVELRSHLNTTTASGRIDSVFDDLKIETIEAQDGVVFLDTFDRRGDDFGDINTGLLWRQSGGAVTSSYTPTIVGAGGGITLGANGSLGSDTFLMRTKGPAESNQYSCVDLDTDFGSNLIGRRWEFSYRTRLQRAIVYSGYTGFTVGNPADTTSGAGNGFSFEIEPYGAWKVYSAGSQVGSGNAGENTFYNNYTVTAAFDEVAGTAALTVYFEASSNTVSLGSFPATFADGSRFFELRNSINTNTTATGVIDAVFDDLKITADPSGYAAWADRYGLVEGPSGDDDADGLSNLYEYGLGGNPTNALDKGASPSFGVEGSGFSYVYPRLSDPDSGLAYFLETCTDLVGGAWTNAGVAVMGTNVTGGQLDFVTNVVDTVEDQKFIRLIIE